jgi:aspartyl/asparaginyl-tRNA synthetase
MYEELIPHVQAKHFDSVASKLRTFFHSKGYRETHPQNRLSILAACEDPKTIATFEYNGKTWPLPQTNQMWLEHDILTENDTGLFCFTTSYRNEPNPITGRHNLIFPMFEFECRGNYDQLNELLVELIHFLGFIVPPMHVNYMHAGQGEIVTPEIEAGFTENTKQGMLLKYFPEFSNPFWNMKRIPMDDTTFALKTDVILGGMETIGAAQRSTNPEEMYNRFISIEDGEYAKQLFYLFGTPRVMEELNTFLSLPFFDRFGGGIGITRLINAMIKANLI